MMSLAALCLLLVPVSQFGQKEGIRTTLADGALVVPKRAPLWWGVAMATRHVAQLEAQRAALRLGCACDTWSKGGAHDGVRYCDLEYWYGRSAGDGKVWTRGVSGCAKGCVLERVRGEDQCFAAAPSSAAAVVAPAATAATTANAAATAAAAIAVAGRARLDDNAAAKVVAPATARDESTADPATLVALDAAEAAKHPPHTVLVMSDSRPLAAAAAGGYLSLAYLLNRAYARRHGYHLHFVQTACVDPADDIKSCACCAHATMGPRSSPWCKLVSVNRTMHAFPSAQRVVYLDSDAFVWAQGVKLETMVFKHFGARVLGLPNNLPWTMPPANSGIQFWRNTPGGRRLLQQWWDWPVTPWSNRHHEFEQAVLHEGFLKVHAREIVVFGHMKVMAPGPLPPPRKQFIAHVCGAWAAKRIPIMDAALCVIEHRRFTTFPGGCLHMPPSVPPPPVGRCPCALVTKPVAGWLSLN